MIIDIYGNFLARNNPFLQVIRELDRTKDVKINLMGPVHPSLFHIQRRKYLPGEYALGFGTPREMQGMHKGSYKLKMGYTAWETTKIPYGDYYGSEKIIKQLDLLIVPNSYNKYLFWETIGNIKIIPLPYNHWVRRRERIKDDFFTYLCEGTLTLKNNVGSIISAFLALYKDDLNTRLILKTDSGTLGHLRFPYKNIEIIDQVYSPKELLELYDKTDVFIYPSSAESYPISTINALAADLPVVLPNHSNFTYYPGLKLLKHPYVKAERYSEKYGDVGLYYSVDYDELKNTMKKSRDSSLKSYGNYIRKTHNVKTFSNDIIKLIKESL
jgi:glycosyltransferase involved in cell wall biosynthesis